MGRKSKKVKYNLPRDQFRQNKNSLTSFVKLALELKKGVIIIHAQEYGVSEEHEGKRPRNQRVQGLKSKRNRK